MITANIVVSQSIPNLKMLSPYVNANTEESTLKVAQFVESTGYHTQLGFNLKNNIFLFGSFNYENFDQYNYFIFSRQSVTKNNNFGFGGGVGFAKMSSKRENLLMENLFGVDYRQVDSYRHSINDPNNILDRLDQTNLNFSHVFNMIFSDGNLQYGVFVRSTVYYLQHVRIENDRTVNVANENPSPFSGKAIWMNSSGVFLTYFPFDDKFSINMLAGFSSMIMRKDFEEETSPGSTSILSIRYSHGHLRVGLQYVLFKD